MKRKSNYFKVAATLLSTTLLFACSNNSESVIGGGAQQGNIGESAEINVSALINEKVKYDKDDLYSDWQNEDATLIKLNGADVTFDSAAPLIYQDNILSIITGGTYVLSGELNNGKIVIDAEDKSTVRLVLNGVKINNSNSSAIEVVNAEKTVISLAEGTENYILDGKQYVFEDSSEDEPNAALFSKDDLTINGSGKLIVQGNYNDGIVSKDKLKITGGDIQIHSVDDGLMGRDLLAVKEGKITIEAKGDGIKSSNDKDASKGIIALEGGTFDIKSGKDGIQAETSLWISDGFFKIISGGGSPEKINNAEEKMRGPWENNSEPTSQEETDTGSTKGLKAAGEIVVGGGTFTIDSLDDGVHSNDSVKIADGEFTIATGDDGVHADSSLLVAGGKINVSKSYEGVESQQITINDGEIHVTTEDDGINIGGGNDGSGFDVGSPVDGNTQLEAEDNANTDDSAKTTTSTENDTESKMLTINGGYITVNANGDGLDANGSITMTDGTVIVNGPTANGNGSIDYDGSFDISGGLLIAVGSSGMAQSPSDQSSQHSLLMSYSKTQAAGTTVHLEDDQGNSVVTFSPQKDYQSVVISSPKLVKDSSYTLFSGGTATGKVVDGLYSDGDYQGGTKVVTFKISDSVTWLNESGITTASSHGPGGGGFGGGSNRHEGTRGGKPQDLFKDLDEVTREKAQTIMEQERAGTISREEAQKQLEELGVKFPGMQPKK